MADVDTSTIVAAAGKVDSAAQGVVQGGNARSIDDLEDAMPGSDTGSHIYNIYKSADLGAHYLAQACGLYAQALRTAAANYDRTERANTIGK